MLERFRRLVARLRGEAPPATPYGPETQAEREMDFQPLSPIAGSSTGKASGAGNPRDVNCVCPVTRRPLRAGMRIYQCRECKMSYSPEGWEFLRKTDRGRCCGCRSARTIFPLT